MDKIHSIETVHTITGKQVGKYELSLVSHEGIPYVFPHVMERFVDAFDQRAFNEYGVEELYRRLCAGEAQLWLVAEKGANLVMVGVTRVIRYPGVKRLSVDWIVGSDLQGCVLMLDVVEHWAKQFGCTEIEASCRPGVRKVMENHGFSRLYEVIVKPIAGSTH